MTLSGTDYRKNGNWSGTLSADFPLTISAVPEAGYRFAGWEGSVTSGEAVLSFAAGENKKNLTLTPVFVRSEEQSGEGVPGGMEGQETPTPLPQGENTPAKEKRNLQPWLILAVCLLAGGAVLFIRSRKNK